jgi:NAD(P)H-quinone oxidoreductase subunit 2
MNQQLPNFAQALQLLTPEITVIFGIILTALWPLFFPKARAWTPTFAVISLAVATMQLATQLPLDGVLLFRGLYTVDKLTVAFGMLSCVVGIIVVTMAMGYERHFGNNRGEFYAILLTAVLSVMLLAGTTDLIMLFVTLETLTISCVLLSGFQKTDKRSNEAALKYLLSTAATTATFLYGLSFLYGLTGSTNYYDIHQSMYQMVQSPSLVVIFLLVLLLSAIGFKLSMVPFHMWSPDVYEGAPTPVTAYLSVGSKLGGLVVAIRLLTVVFDSAASDWTIVVGALAIISMIVGNMIAMAQTSLKRMLAYSSIAHVGYLLIGLVANTNEGLSAMLFYIIVYGFMNLGAFTGAILFANEVGTDNIDDMAGLIRKRPWLAVLLAVCLLNLAGLPVPPAGFLAKVFVFWAGFQMYSNLGYMMVVAALLTSIPAIYYYTRVVIKMVVAEPSDAVQALPENRQVRGDSEAGPKLAMALSILGIIFGTFWVNPLMDFSSKAIASVKAPTIGSLPEGDVH